MSQSNHGNRPEQSIRLFQNNFLEALTHVHPIVPLLFWSPVVALLLWRSIVLHGVSLPALLGVAICGVLVWTLSEYLLHRFVFHYSASSAAGKWLVFLFHGVHHETPRDKTRLVMPPAGAIIILFFLWQLFSLVLPTLWLEPFLAFFIVGYLIYDYIHYATHHFQMQHPLLHFLKRYHLQHHYGAKGLRYGVSSPLWDRVFGTWPTDRAARG